MPDTTARFYAAIPDAQKAFLRAFNATHAQTSLSIDDVTWSYYDSEEGEEVLLLLHGGYADFTMWIHQIVEFEKDYRVIAPTCPPLPDARMKVYSDALYAILMAETMWSLMLSPRYLTLRQVNPHGRNHVVTHVVTKVFNPATSKSVRRDLALGKTRIW